MDLTKPLRRATEAARRGDVDRLEMELAQLRSVPTTDVTTVGTRLRAIARSVRCHPSFREAERAQAV